MDLFADQNTTLEAIPIDDGELYFLPRLPLAQDAVTVMQRLIDETAWRAESITLYGKTMLQPRLSAWHGDPDARYTYSGTTFEPQPFTPLQLDIKQAVEAATGLAFNSVLLNYYRNEQDSMGFHSDDERELGRNPAIASVSFGDPRTFILKHKTMPKTVKIALGNGSLLLMAGALQHHWRHGINKEKTQRGARISLTFRKIVI
ncbi:alpha-ketoglutarate-dependent dioxygenase AlkB [Pseudoduganella ginsengisoli]|uniref:Alpha-ketoglutarate-dependent dioxygenase AlkB n=1 Tax=Pseudoduganella ginsengisoli TaxID=1462440 RepID=A0A6L6PY65_9BURK|nr:alpha-ketoglutarate-dependent dioxygenase AlkB [Pseudoduganella ginsengisoli]MTW02497.1 alpha-ketoglutarate-dependent dioxygenase AlkB [Pseudoduganella ginsengisoli]